MGSSGLTCGMLRGAKALSCLTSVPESVYSVLVAGTANAKGSSIGNEIQFFKHGEARNESSGEVSVGSVATAGIFPRNLVQCWGLAPSPEVGGGFASLDSACAPSSDVALQLMSWSNGDLQEQGKVILQSKSDTAPGSIDWKGHRILVALDEGYSVAQVREGAVEVVTPLTSLGTPGYRTARIDPHENSLLAVSSEGRISIVDTRLGNAEKPVVVVEGPRAGGLVNDIDFSPIRRKVFVAAYTDGQLRSWDLRSPRSVSTEMKAHTNWACCVRYNPLHDGLIISSGSDGVVQLWKDVDIQSSGDLQIPNSDKVASETFPDHDTSVYGLTWECTDEFSFVSVSYDGRLRINQVPGPIKHQILLE